MPESSFHPRDILPFPDDRESWENRKLRTAAMEMEHDLFFLYVFLEVHDLSEDACEFLAGHADDPLPFRRYL